MHVVNSEKPLNFVEVYCNGPGHFRGDAKLESECRVWRQTDVVHTQNVHLGPGPSTQKICEILR